MGYGIEAYGVNETLELSKNLSLKEYLDLLELTNSLRLERDKQLSAQRGEVHPEERKKTEEALDKYLNKIGTVEINGIKFNESPKVQQPVSKRKNPINKGQKKENT